MLREPNSFFGINITVIMKQFFKYFFGLWSVIFLLFAYLQWNDPDSFIWVSVYGLAAVLSAFAFFGRFSVSVLFSVALLGLIIGIYFFPNSVGGWISQEMHQANLSMMKSTDIEQARESFGLLVVSLVMGLAAYRGWSKDRIKTENDQPSETNKSHTLSGAQI